VVGAEPAWAIALLQRVLLSAAACAQVRVAEGALEA
jgi:hypothetical protein